MPRQNYTISLHNPLHLKLLSLFWIHHTSLWTSITPTLQNYKTPQFPYKGATHKLKPRLVPMTFTPGISVHMATVAPHT